MTGAIVCSGTGDVGDVLMVFWFGGAVVGVMWCLEAIGMG